MVQYDVKRVTNGTESFMVTFDFAKTPITQIADSIIIAASRKSTSDIHFYPREDGMMVRFRIDGDCQDYTFIPKVYERNLATRLKLLANMNITESRLPQDGAIKGEFGGQFLDMRVSCLPTNEGEKIVIRILDYSRSLSGIDSLGFHPKNLEKIKRMSAVPNGIILVTGATGSGKSTTTYSVLSGLNKPETNIITVEDPVEMNIEGINQVQVNADIGMTFAAALRSILRQDPNVILIGEIRDSETAKIAIRASITGHLVLSTLHTNNALATIERLLDMDVERYLLSTALTGVVSQRLAKKLCTHCKIKRKTTKYEKKIFKQILNKDVDEVWDANPKGCEHCRRGYKGRIAFHEVLELDDDIRAALNNEKLEKEDLIKMVYTPKTITMLQDALIKNLNGETSFEEVYKTIEIESDDESYVPPVIEVIEPEAEQEENLLDDNTLFEEKSTPINLPMQQTVKIKMDEEPAAPPIEGKDIVIETVNQVPPAKKIVPIPVATINTPNVENKNEIKPTEPKKEVNTVPVQANQVIENKKPVIPAIPTIPTIPKIPTVLNTNVAQQPVTNKPLQSNNVINKKQETNPTIPTIPNVPAIKEIVEVPQSIAPNTVQQIKRDVSPAPIAPQQIIQPKFVQNIKAVHTQQLTPITPTISDQTIPQIQSSEIIK